MKTLIRLLLPACLAGGLYAAELVEYNFSDTPTPSKMDPDFVGASVTASDITEFGDPDGGGTSPELTNFSGASLNIKRNALNTSPMDFSSYLTFTVSALDTNQVIDAEELDVRFNQFSDDFSFMVFINAGEGFRLVAELGGAGNSNLVNSTQQLTLANVPATRAMTFRIECAHSAPGGAANTTLQLAEISLHGAVGEPAGFPDDSDALEMVLDGASTNLMFSWPGAQGNTYALETKTNLLVGGWEDAAAGILGNGGLCRATDTVERAQGFYRVAVTASNAPSYAYYDIRDYGAVLDDGLCDADAVQAAIDAADAGTWNGGTVYFPAGVTTLSKPVMMKTKVSLLGEGTPGVAGGSIIRAKDSPQLTCLLYGRDPEMRYLSIEHLTFDGNGLTFPWAIDFEDAINLRIANVRIENMVGGGISQIRSDGDPCWVNFYENIEIDIIGHAGIGFIHGDSDSFLTDLKITGADIGILEIDGGANRFRNVAVSNCINGLVIRDGANEKQANSIFDSLFVNNLENGMVISNTTVTQNGFIPLHRNVFSGNGQRDLYLKDTSCIAVHNNEFQSSLTNDAIYMDSGSVDSVTLVGNRFANASQTVAGVKSTAYENQFGLLSEDFYGLDPLDIGPPPIIPPNVLCDINVKEAPYNAVGNNNADDTIALQTALDNAPDGAIVYLPAGRYKITAPLQLKSAVTLLGEYSGTWISAHSNMSSMIRVDPAVGSLTNVLLSKLTLDGGSGNGFSVDTGVTMNNMAGCTLDRINVRSLTGTAILIPASGHGNVVRSCSVGAQDTQVQIEGSGNTIASVYGGGGSYYNELGGARCGIRIKGGARFNTIYTSHFDHTRATNSVAAIHFDDPTGPDQATVIRNSYFDLHYKGLFMDYDALANANVVFEGNMFRAVIGEGEYVNRNASQVYLHGNVCMDDFSTDYIRHETMNQDYIEVIGNLFKASRSYTLPGSHSVDAANTSE